ncbi:hypothetical protein GXP67_13435 [Rhodocytophaga rosea]|uniref:Uncharacterized protein n=1 Tax=Rhodocytophaga rosea TaxID=2704465 RepID=A0A6C0GHT0_9BACT|nr:hypothetical protein [Rhodocytophaga rosea]QHT67558.1 hypothetical protein GXP67_13435 [Rhodocytophaga rosea]
MEDAIIAVFISLIVNGINAIFLHHPDEQDGAVGDSERTYQPDSYFCTTGQNV